MSETSSLRGKTILIEAQNENGTSSGMAPEGPSKHLEEAAPPARITASLDEDSEPPAPVPLAVEESSGITPERPSSEHREKAARIAEKFSSTSSRPSSLDEDSEQSVPPRNLLNSAPDVMQPNRQRRKKKHRSVFGLTHEVGLNNRDAYEQKYTRDRCGEETSENARIWLTYLDEAEPFDRERVEEWKGAADVLLVFAGLFSSVITTFIVQALQSLQQDNTQVSASLLFTIAGILRAQSDGTPLNMIPNSTLTPMSPFTPSKNALLVNGLWFTSLAITLSTALFAVIAKQWPRYSLSSIPGTAKERARARQLRFKGFEVWKVGTILDLLPVLLYLAVGLFLMGIIIMLFPLNAAIAWTIVGITGITYTLYFISVILPIRYPECPYTTSMTIYVGVLFFVLRKALRGIGAILNWVDWRKINFKIRRTIRTSAYYAIGFIPYGIRYGIRYEILYGFVFNISRLARVMRRGFQRLRGNFTEFIKWREDKIKQVVQTATDLDFEAVSWLYGISWSRSVHRMIARCAAVNPIISHQFGSDILGNLNRSLEIGEGNVVDLRYGLCLDLLTSESGHWRLLQSIPEALGNHLEEGEFQSYLRIADTVLQRDDKLQALHGVIKGNCRLPMAMWGYLLGVTPDAIIAKHILVSMGDTGLIHFESEELGWSKFHYLFGHLEAETYETCYNLLLIIYRNLTSDDRLDIGEERKQKSLRRVFDSFWDHVFRLTSSDSLCPLEDGLRLAYALRFFREICCVDSFWCVSMTDEARCNALLSLRGMLPPQLADIQLDNHLPFTDGHDLSLIYQWYSRDLDPKLSFYTCPLFMLLLMSQNRHHLITILLNDTNAVSNFSKCVQNLADCSELYRWNVVRVSQMLIMMDLLKSVDPKKNPRLFTVLYDRSVLLQLWALLVYYDHDTKEYFLLLNSMIARDKLDELYAAMNELVQSDCPNLFIAFQNIWARNLCPGLVASVREFGQLIGVSQIQPEATSEQSAPGNAPSINDHDNEERAQVPGPDERRNFNVTGNWMKKMFESIRLKILRQPSDLLIETAIPFTYTRTNSEW